MTARPRRTWPGAAAWACLGAVILELLVREVARTSLLLKATGLAPAPWLLAAAGISAGLLLARLARPPAPAPRAPRGALLFAALFAAGLAAQLHLGARLQSDGFYYFAYLRSIAFDGDVEFSNDYRLLGLGDKAHLFTPTPTGYAQSAWTIGPAIVWSPFFAGGHAAAAVLNRHDPDVSTNGVSFPYRQAVSVAGLFYALVGCWFCYLIAARYYPEPTAAAATALVVLGSFMIWYIVKEPSMTHAPSMAAVAAFIYGWIATRGDDEEGRGRTMRQWAWLGLLAGFMTLIRWQNALFALLPACEALGALVAARRAADPARLRRTLAGGALFTLCATIGFVPQMIAWQSIYGSWLAVSPVGPQIRWFDPQIVDILFSSRNGLFSWSPVLYIGGIGLLLFAAARPSIGVPMVLAVALMTYFNASVQDWWGSAGYGGRRFDGTLPIFSLGMAAALTWGVAAIQRHPWRIAIAAGGVLVAWNLALMSAAHEGVVRIGESVSFGHTSAAQARALHRWVGNPFTYPTSLVFALQNGVPPSGYDLLSANRFLGDHLRPYGRVDIGQDDEWLLEDGWHGAEREGDGTTFRWVDSPATMKIPLDHAAPLTLQLRLHAFGYPDAPPQTLTVHVNDLPLAAVPVSNGWQALSIETDEGLWRGGVNRLRFEFSRAARPADVGLGGDGRRLAAAIDSVRIVKR